VAPVALIHVTLSFTHHISTAHMSSNRNINIISRKQSCTWIQEYLYSNNACNINNDSCNRNTETINACIPVNLYNSVIKIWNNCVQSIHVTVSSIIAYPCISGSWTWNNSVVCISIYVIVIHVHGITISSVTGIYKKYCVVY